MSKMATVDYLKSHFDEDVDLSRIYRYLDRLYDTEQEAVQRISVQHTFSVLGGRVEMLFYDVTSLYFESFREDNLRSPGFSKNIGMLRSGKYKFIMGARIRKAGKKLAGWLTSLPHEDGVYHETKLDNGDRLIVTYSSKRAAKDAYNRQKGVERRKKAYASGKVTKDKINRRGYSKFLNIDSDVSVSINEEKIREDEKWDGLKCLVLK